MTTTSLSTGEEKAISIKERPHWRTHIAPPTADGRFGDGKQARDAAVEAAVLIRGWDYPHFHQVDGGGNAPVPGGWESWTDFRPQEAWRITQSGQFIHYSELHEDAAGSPTAGNPPVVSFEALVCRVTEIFEFTQRLVEKADYTPSVNLNIRLSRMKERQLVTNPYRYLFDRYVSKQNDITIARELNVTLLPSRKHEHSLDALSEILSYFGIDDPPRDVLSDLQSRFLEKKSLF